MTDINELKKFIKTKNEILNEKFDNIDDEEFLLKCFLINPQSYGAKIEKRFINKNNFKKIPATVGKGDCINGEDNYEIKSSLSCDNIFNVVQIRLWQNVNYYFIFINFDVELSISVLEIPHNDMIDIVKKYGQAAHGTKSANDSNKNIEYRMTIKNELLCFLKSKYLISNSLKVIND